MRACSAIAPTLRVRVPIGAAPLAYSRCGGTAAFLAQPMAALAGSQAHALRGPLAVPAWFESPRPPRSARRRAGPGGVNSPARQGAATGRAPCSTLPDLAASGAGCGNRH